MSFSTPNSGISGANDVALSNPANDQVLTYVSGTAKWQNRTMASGAASDATASAKGVVQLAGDLGGTAASPTVPGLTTKVDKSTLPANSLLKADVVSTPSALAVAAATLVGRAASGGIASLTAAQVKALLSVVIGDVSGLESALKTAPARIDYSFSTSTYPTVTTALGATFDADRIIQWRGPTTPPVGGGYSRAGKDEWLRKDVA